ncbi:hypothetical protein FA09DRAFT_332293 [Tilletiopsis washingtonensis]|uniref:Uncharacterized protein n=1 Tax=Tilletiopsis washingtonensis TaxID=58919 RepID=A0A316Z0Q6_9BASI|nr:hypothetical protein FA09DRAFT_332293 [Tilletiopsis washingtonensis]PWN95109.1 hypothetical protein FA09DRAFT_332293 [Tilletiopsis washingtonensis]
MSSPSLSQPPPTSPGTRTSPRRAAGASPKASTPRTTAALAAGRPSQRPSTSALVQRTSRGARSSPHSTSGPGGGSAREAKERAERAALEQQLADAELDVRRLRGDLARERARRSSASATDDSQSRRQWAAEQAELERRLREADDEALTAILTSTPSALSQLLGFGPAAGGDSLGGALLPAPLIEAGGMEETDPEARLAGAKAGLNAQEEFSGLRLTRVETTDQSSSRRGVSLHYAADNEMFSLQLDIREDAASTLSAASTPRVERMQARLPSQLRGSLEPHVARWERAGDAPALLIAVRTRRALLQVRSRLFESLSSARPDLCRGQSTARETLTFENSIGAKLVLRSPVSFSRWGSARCTLSLSSELPESAEADARTATMLRELSARFEELLEAADPGPSRVYDATLAVVTAFFGDGAQSL